MIDNNSITAWTKNAPWPDTDQIEQDLILSKCIIELSNDSFLRDELAFRGGTCLHKIIFPQPYRYSEDLDFVRVSQGPIKAISARVQQIANKFGFETSTRPENIFKIYLKYTSISSASKKIKIEIETTEKVEITKLIKRHHSVESDWYTGSSEVLTFLNEDLIASKFSALYNRSKGRDLFDLWLAITQIDMNSIEVKNNFKTYFPNFDPRKFKYNLELKLQDPEFLNDLYLLTTNVPNNYSALKAQELVIEYLEI